MPRGIRELPVRSMSVPAIRVIFSAILLLGFVSRNHAQSDSHCEIRKTQFNQACCASTGTPASRPLLCMSSHSSMKTLFQWSVSGWLSMSR